eukprot:s448_g31.t1
MGTTLVWSTFWFEKLVETAWHVGAGDDHTEISMGHQAILSFGRKLKGTAHCRCGSFDYGSWVCGHSHYFDGPLRYKPYLEATGLQSVDNFIYTGDRVRGETFAAFLSRKEVKKQELESQLGGEVLNPVVAGCILLRQAGVVNALRPLDRLETLSKAAALPGGAVPVQRTYLQAGEDADDAEDEEEPEEEDEEYSDSELADDMLRFEDREFDETEAIHVQAYNDVRKDLRTRKRERGFVRHRGAGGSSKGPQKKQFVTVGGTGCSTSTYMFQQMQPMPFPPPPTTLMRAVYAGVRVRAFEGVVDTAAEEAVVGSQSFNGMREELRSAGLRPVPVRLTLWSF